MANDVLYIKCSARVIKMLRWVVDARSREESRPALNLVRVLDGSLVTTDGFQLRSWSLGDGSLDGTPGTKEYREQVEDFNSISEMKNLPAGNYEVKLYADLARFSKPEGYDEAYFDISQFPEVGFLFGEYGVGIHPSVFDLSPDLPGLSFSQAIRADQLSTLLNCPWSTIGVLRISNILVRCDFLDIPFGGSVVGINTVVKLDNPKPEYFGGVVAMPGKVARLYKGIKNAVVAIEDLQPVAAA